jgi:hypothetical protein
MIEENQLETPVEASDKEDQILSDQTSFGLESPLFAPKKKPKSLADMTPEELAAHKRKKLLMAVLVGVGIFLVLVIIMAVMLKRRTPGRVSPEASAEPESSQTLSPLEQKVETLRQDLRQADPTRQDTPFPPVDLTIELDEVKQ